MAMTTATQRTVAILGSGDMGSAVGGAFARAGFRVVTDLSRRSAGTRATLPRERSLDAALAVFSAALESGLRRESLR
jgi:predicted dinucleotide-binding enzyme